MASLVFGRKAHVPAETPRAALVIGTILSMLTISVLAVCLGESPQYITLRFA